MQSGSVLKDDGQVSFFSMIPHMVDDAGLSAYGYRLYGHLKRVAGDNGQCWQSQDTLEKACLMSNRTVVKAKRELIKAGLITITLDIVQGHPHHVITVVNVWQQNENVYRGKSAPDVLSVGVEQHLQSVEDSTSKNTHERIPNSIEEEGATIELTTEQSLLLNAVRAMPYWDEEPADSGWLVEFQAEFPSIIVQDIVACRDYHDGKGGKHHKGVWKNRLRNWMKNKERGNGKTRRHTGEATAQQLSASVGKPIDG